MLWPIDDDEDCGYIPSNDIDYVVTSYKVPEGISNEQVRLNLLMQLNNALIIKEESLARWLEWIKEAKEELKSRQEHAYSAQLEIDTLKLQISRLKYD